VTREVEYDYKKHLRQPSSDRQPFEFWLDFRSLLDLLCHTAKAARGFYNGQVEHPGYLQVSVGLLDVRDYRMTRLMYEGDTEPCTDPFNRYTSKGKFPDPVFRADFMTTTHEFLKDINPTFTALLHQVMDGFDLPRFPESWDWTTRIGW
jgi:hypothetical protein